MSPTLEAAILSTGWRWSVDDSYKISNLVGEIQHRSDAKLHKPTVKRYANQFRAGSIPPHIGVTHDGRSIWGHHRIGGANEAAWAEIPAIVFDVDGADAVNDPFLKNTLLSLAVAENAPNGLPYNPADRIGAGQALLALGYTNTAVQKELGLSPSQVSGIKAEMDADARLKKVKVTATLTRSVKRILSGPDARALNDEPFRRLAELAAQANMTPDEVRGAAKAARVTGSETGALDSLADWRSDNTDRIAQVALGGVVRPTPVGKMTGLCKQVSDLCSSAPSVTVYRDRTADAAETKAAIEAAIACLNGILAVQEDDES